MEPKNLTGLNPTLEEIEINLKAGALPTFNYNSAPTSNDQNLLVKYYINKCNQFRIVLN
jgi:hypothetical protein